MKIFKSDIDGKLTEQGIHETKVIRIGLKIREKSLFGNKQKICKVHWEKMRTFQFLNSNYLSKTNLNYLKSDDY